MEQITGGVAVLVLLLVLAGPILTVVAVLMALQYLSRIARALDRINGQLSHLDTPDMRGVEVQIHEVAKQLYESRATEGPPALPKREG